MENRAGSVILIWVLVAACAGVGTSPTGASIGTPLPTAPAGATPALAASPTIEPMSVVWISNSTGSGGVPEAYGRRIEADLGVRASVESAWTPNVSIVRILEALDGANGGFIQSGGSGRVNLPDLVRAADVIVASGNPIRSDSPGHPQGAGCSVYFEASPSCEPVTACGPETWQQYEANIVAVIDQIFKIREGRPVILRTHDYYLPWGPLATWQACDCVDACVACWGEWSDAIHRAGAARSVPVAGYLEAFSGSAGDEPLPSAWTRDDVHPSEVGAEALAGVMADLGYDLVAPPGG